MTIGGIVAVIGIIGAFANILAVHKSKSFLSVVIRHLVFGLMYLGGGLSFMIGLIFYIIKICKS